MPATLALNFQRNFEGDILVSNAVPVNFTAEPAPHCCGRRVETKEAREGMPVMSAVFHVTGHKSSLLVSKAVPAYFNVEALVFCCDRGADDTVLRETTPVGSGVLMVALRAGTGEETGRNFNGRVQRG